MVSSAITVVGLVVATVFLLAAVVDAQPAVGTWSVASQQQQQQRSAAPELQVLCAGNGTNALGCGASWASPCASPAFALAALENATQVASSMPWRHDVSQVVAFSQTHYAVRLILAQGSYNATARIQLLANTSVTIQGPDLGDSVTNDGLTRTIRAVLRCPGHITLQSALITARAQAYLGLLRLAVTGCVVLPQGGVTTGVPTTPAVVHNVDSSALYASQCVFADNHGYWGECTSRVALLLTHQALIAETTAQHC